jgi:hypothetical protein
MGEDGDKHCHLDQRKCRRTVAGEQLPSCDHDCRTEGHGDHASMVSGKAYCRQKPDT